MSCWRERRGRRRKGPCALRLGPLTDRPRHARQCRHFPAVGRQLHPLPHWPVSHTHCYLHTVALCVCGYLGLKLCTSHSVHTQPHTV